MRAAAVLQDAYGRLAEAVPAVLDGLDADALAHRPGPSANPIGWLVWHLARVQDSHVAEVLGAEQVWSSGPWASQLDLAADPSNSGYGHTDEEVAAVRPPGPEPLVGYYQAVWARTEAYLARLEDEDLDRIVDRSWDPPVSLGVRLVSIVEDSFQHLGQAAYLRGLLGR